MLLNADFFAKFRIDTAENEPAKNLQNFTNKPQAAPLRFAPRHRGGGLERICRAEVDIRTAASPRGETIAVQR